jgi:hypothetical protein
VLDKKSDHAAFTGVDDGQTTKTLNLTLKEDRKKGYFGKVEAGAGTDGYYNNNGVLGSFKGKRQFAALGMLANTGTTGFSGSGGGGNDAVALALNADLSDVFTASAGPGVPQAMGGGLHYSNKWNNNGEHVSGNYSFGHTLTYPVATTINQQILPDTVYVQKQQSQSINSKDQHFFSGVYEGNLDTLSSFYVSLNGSSTIANNQFSQRSATYLNNVLVNTDDRRVNSNVYIRDFSNSLFWKRKFCKPGRVISATGVLGMVNNEATGYLYSSGHFFNAAGSFLDTNTVDQKKILTARHLDMDGSLDYTEPLWKNAVLAMRYGLSLNEDHSSFGTYNKANEKYDAYVDSLSSHFRSTILSQREMVNLRVDSRSFNCTLGIIILQYNFKQTDLLTNAMIGHHYNMISSHIQGHYNLDQTHIVFFTYNEVIQQPSISQLQPTHNNNDPFHIAIGNPNLQPTHTHYFRILFIHSGQAPINVGLRSSFSFNNISTWSYTDSLGRQIYQAVNVNGDRNVEGYFSFDKKELLMKLDLSMNVYASGDRSINFVNDLVNKNDTYIIGGRLRLERNVPDKFLIQASSDFSYSFSHSSVNERVKSQYWSQNNLVLLSFFLNRSFELNTNCKITFLKKNDLVDSDNTLVIWNAYLNKTFSANRFSLRMLVNDILGHNSGISRFVSTNQVAESHYNVVGRYWMLSLIYRFAKKGSD